MNADLATIDHVARSVTRAYVRRGCQYDPADMYQDAAETAHKAARNFDPARGVPLAGYLYHACWRTLSDRITKGLQPASTRRKEEIKHLRNLKRVQVPADTADDFDYDEALHRTQIRERLLAVAERVPEGHTVLAVMLDYTTIEQLANGDSARAQRLYYCVRRMKKAIREDAQLQALAR